MTSQRFVSAIAVASLLFAAGCAAGGGGMPLTPAHPGLMRTNTSNAYGSLQFAVGTANLYGNTLPGLNVVTTYRQSDGASATGVNTPKLAGNFFITRTAVPSFGDANPGFPDPYATIFNNGPSFREGHGNALTGTPQTVEQGTPACDGGGPFPGTGFVRCPAGLAPNTTTFGQSGGVFAMGLEPSNNLPSAGQPYSLQPYSQPLFSANDPISKYQFLPYGGPPAYDPDNDGMGFRDGGFVAGADQFGDPYYIGLDEGYTVVDGVKIRRGQYSLSIAISVAGSGGVTTTNTTATAHLPTLAKLETVHSPVFHPDGNGGGFLGVLIPPGVTEALLQIVDFGPGGGPHDGAASGPSNCQGVRGTAFAPVYYTIHVTRSGRYQLPDRDGPNLATNAGVGNLQPSPSVCTKKENTTSAGKTSRGDDIVVQLIGFDYPAYEIGQGLISNTPPENPRISNGAGRADITISQAAEQDDESTSAVPLLVARKHVPYVRPIHR